MGSPLSWGEWEVWQTLQKLIYFIYKHPNEIHIQQDLQKNCHFKRDYETQCYYFSLVNPSDIKYLNDDCHKRKFDFDFLFKHFIQWFGLIFLIALYLLSTWSSWLVQF